MNLQPVAVVGAGSWGTALAMVMARNGREVRLVARNAETAGRMQQSRENQRYLPAIHFPPSLYVTADLDAALDGICACVVAVPCMAAESYLPSLVDGHYPVIAVFKGLHPESMIRSDQVLAKYLPADRIAILSGPSFAYEVALGHPTAITMAASTIEQAERATAYFNDTNFRIYTSNDVIGVAMGGALKNVIAIAAGAAEGLGFGHNSIAAAVTRGLAEMARLTIACGGRQETMMGLSGLGDLVLTCTGGLSRNRKLGIALAQGLDVDSAVASIGQVVEGVRTAQAAVKLADKIGIEAPLIRTIHHVLQGRIDMRSAVKELMSRPERSEVG